MRHRVLFVCSHNGARSQMAAALLDALCGDRYEAESAGIEPGRLDPLAVAVMAEKGIDISRSPTRSVFDLYKAGRLYEYVITVCDREAAERCPIFPGPVTREQWSFADPASFVGTENERLTKTRAVRDEIEAKVVGFCRASVTASASTSRKSPASRRSP